MFRLIYITIVLILPLQTMATTMYVVKLAVYKNGDALKKEIDKLSPEARKLTHITIKKDKNFASSIETEEREILEKLLPEYKKVFSDAFILEFQRKTKPKPIQPPHIIPTPKVIATTPPATPQEISKESAPKEEINATIAEPIAKPDIQTKQVEKMMTQERAALSPQLQPSQVTKTEPKLETIAQANQPFPIIQTPPEASNIPKIKEKLPTLCDFVKQNIQPPHPKTTKVLNPKQQDISLYERVHRKKLYLCAYAPDEWSPNILIEINFLDDKVTFTPLQGKVMAKEEKYKVQNERIYISQDGTYDDEMYKTIEKITDNYYLLTTWIGTRKLTSIRYYFDLEKAKQYLATLR